MPATNCSGLWKSSGAVPVKAHVDPQSTAVAHFVSASLGTLPNTIVLSTTMADAANTVFPAGGFLTGGENAEFVPYHVGEHVVLAQEVSALSIVIETGLKTTNGIREFEVSVRTATGVYKTITSILTKVLNLTTGHRILIDFDGATNPAAGDVVSWQAIGRK